MSVLKKPGFGAPKLDVAILVSFPLNWNDPLRFLLPNVGEVVREEKSSLSRRSSSAVGPRDAARRLSAGPSMPTRSSLSSDEAFVWREEKRGEVSAGGERRPAWTEGGTTKSLPSLDAEEEERERLNGDMRDLVEGGGVWRSVEPPSSAGE